MRPNSNRFRWNATKSFSCNVFRLSDEHRPRVKDGFRRSLVLAPGDQVEEDYFDQKLYKGGKGLRPLNYAAYSVMKPKRSGFISRSKIKMIRPSRYLKDRRNGSRM